MPNYKPQSLPHRLRKAKAALLAVALTLAGILVIMLGGWLSSAELGSWTWVRTIPFGEIGGALFGAGVLGTLFEYSFRKDQEEATLEQFRQIIREQAPAMREAVIEGFRFDTDDLRRISTPQLLDELAVNSLGMRFGDAAFGREVYADIKHQAISAEERWLDARVDATLGIPRVRGVTPNPFFDLLVRWEYTVVPKHRFRKFAVVSDRQRYDQLTAERGETSVWFRRPSPGFKVNDPEVFSLAQFTVDGVELPFERQADDVSQVYVVDLGEERVRQGEAVVVSFTFRAKTPRDGRLVHIDIDRPTKGLEVEMKYDPAMVASMRVMDFASRGDGGRVSEEADASALRYRYDGWLFPRAGLVFAWTLADEAPASARVRGTGRSGLSRRAGHGSEHKDDARYDQAA